MNEELLSIRIAEEVYTTEQRGSFVGTRLQFVLKVRERAGRVAD